MKPTSSFAKLVFVLAFTALVIGFSAFSQKPNDNKDSFRKELRSKDDDSSISNKRNRNGSFGNFDELNLQMKDLDIQMQKLDDQMKKIDIQINQKEIDEALKKVDVEKIMAQANEAMKNIDWNEINKNIKESVTALDKVKMEEIKKEMEKMKVELQKEKVNVTIPKIDVEKIKIETQDAMKNARKSIEKAKDEITNLKEFGDALEKDGLINKLKPYHVEVKNGELYIDGKKQSKEVNDKYKKYYRKENFNFDFQKSESL